MIFLLIDTSKRNYILVIEQKETNSGVIYKLFDYKETKAFNFKFIFPSYREIKSNYN